MVGQGHGPILRSSKSGGAASVHAGPKQVKPRHLSAGVGWIRSENAHEREDMVCEPEKESKVFKDQ